MSTENNPTNHEIQLAADLDAFITAQLAGENVSVPPSVPQSEAHLAAMLVEHAKQQKPNPAFAASLEAQLLGANVVDASKVFQIKQKIRTVNSSLWRSHPLHRFSIAAMMLLAISSVVVISTPSLRSLAQTIFEYFSLTSSDMVGSTPVKNTGKRPPLSEEQKRKMREVQMVEQKLQMEMRTTTTLREMEIERGFDLKEPTALPTGYILEKGVVSPSPNVVTFAYRNSQINARIVISEKRLDGEPVIGPILEMPTEEYKSKSARVTISWFPPQPNRLFGSNDPALQQVDKSPVGASAKIEPVQIGNLTAEYVEGGWEPIVDRDGISGMRWNQNAPLRQIQWKQGNVLFQIATTNDLSRDELVAIVNSMK